MKALVYEGAEVMTFREAPDPTPGAGEQLIRVEAVGICGSDMHGYMGHDDRRPPPLILGHEAAGIITGGPRDGERVTVNPLLTCRTCAYCLAGRENICQTRELLSMPPREGAFAQYVATRDANLVTVPNDVPLQTAALAEPLAVSWHTAKLVLDALHPSMERRALVIGGGTIGLAAALCLKAMGCDDVTISEPNPGRRAHLEANAWDKVTDAPQGMFPIVVDAVGYVCGHTRRLNRARKCRRCDCPCGLGRGRGWFGYPTHDPARDHLHRQLLLFG